MTQTNDDHTPHRRYIDQLHPITFAEARKHSGQTIKDVLWREPAALEDRAGKAVHVLCCTKSYDRWLTMMAEQNEQCLLDDRTPIQIEKIRRSDCRDSSRLVRHGDSCSVVIVPLAVWNIIGDACGFAERQNMRPMLHLQVRTLIGRER